MSDAVCAYCETDAATTWHLLGGRTWCPECVFYCDGHQELMPATERGGCEHFTLCVGCEKERYCLECDRADHFFDEVDRQYAASKEGY